ncbi:TPA: sigma-54-dependent Fis family transcriptional regulator [Candidatus Poribacteria bacterium]|nr:sigma-54-dependent Fis family transcriptional regulator [Candidatus Poribacteria bacterium]HIB89942.1 sigma-54-dependent Fis family transcriptional regulator [Candidatus Poribacteria bacterium]
MPSILLVEDEQSQRTILRRVLEREGHEIETADNGKAALELLKNKQFNLVISDMRMPQMTGRDLLKMIKKQWADLPVLIVTAFAELDDAIDLVAREGAFYYLEKPINLDSLKNEVERALNTQKPAINNDTVQKVHFDQIVGDSPLMQELFKKVTLVINRGVNQVLITGETGTGKDLIAKAIHEHGSRQKKMFLPINCSAVPEHLTESEFFGHEKGAFTGADQTKRGLFEIANGGTIFLDEIGDISLQMQSKLLRVLQEREIKRVGGIHPIQVNVCIIAATNKNLKTEMEQGNFRQDLYFRLNVITLHLPPLRDRMEDLKSLIGFFFSRFQDEYISVEKKTLSPEAMSALQRYDWPGNIRQLANCLLRAFILSESSTIQLTDLSAEIHDSSLPPSNINSEIPKGGVSLEDIIREYIKSALTQTQGNQTKAAELLGMSRRKLQSRMKNYNLDSRDFKEK